MPDIGESITVQTTITDDGEAIDPSTIVATVFDPSDVEQTPTVTRSALGEYQTAFTATAAGRWRIRWTTTGPDGVDWSFVDVDVDPPARLDPLATIADLEARIGTLTADQQTRAVGLLLSASAQVRAYCHNQTINYVADDQVLVPAHGRLLRLPQRPVVAVSAVAALGREGGADVPLTGWTWDGRETIDLGQPASTWTSIESSWLYTFDDHANTYRVTYSHGHRTTPAIVVDVVANMVNRVLTSPTLAEGVAQEVVGQWSQQYQQATGSMGAAPRLLKVDKDILTAAGFHRRTGQIKLRAR